MHSYFSIPFNYTTIAWQIEHQISEIFIVDLLELVNKFPPFAIKLLDQFAAFLDSLNDQIMLSSKCNHGDWMNTALSLSPSAVHSLSLNDHYVAAKRTVTDGSRV